ncbi:MAG: family 20 glycosylhydrolase, partial [Clostridia bacterium]
MLTIIPEPKSIQLNESKIFGIEKVSVDIQDKFALVKADLQRFLQDRTTIEVCENAYSISCVVDGAITEPERYKLSMTATKAVLTAGCEQGLFRGLQTLKQLLVQPLCECEIDDEPKTHMRSFMLDVGRYFYPLKDIREIIEWASFYKLNFFHIHLTEDQGWRFESKKYPLLTQK